MKRKTRGARIAGSERLSKNGLARVDLRERLEGLMTEKQEALASNNIEAAVDISRRMRELEDEEARLSSVIVIRT